MAEGAELVLFPNEMDRLLRMPGGPVGIYVRKIAREVAAEASRLAGERLQTRSGRLKNGYRVVVEETGGAEGFRYWVVNTVTDQNPRRKMSYAQVHEEGSGIRGPLGKAYTIRPRPGNRALVFYIDGRKIVTGSVKHPGVRPQHILRDALDNVTSQL